MLQKYKTQLFKLAQLHSQITGRRFVALKDQAIEKRFIDVPMVFISQLSRSGGTMLCQLFDGHSNCLTFPPELKLGKRKKVISDFDSLACESHSKVANELLRYNSNGIKKGIRGFYKKGMGNKDPFILDIFAFEAIFKSLWLHHQPQNGRDVMNIWFSSFFSSWLNYQWPVQMKYCMAFASWTMVNESNVDMFFRYYPDGYLIHVIRDPLSWYESVKVRSESVTRKGIEIYNSQQDATEWYKKQAEIFERNLNKYSGKVILLTYESLVSDRERVMKEICKIIGIDFEQSLLQPTFNGLPGGKNTSFQNGRKRDKVLNLRDRESLHEICGPVYENLLNV